MIMATSYDPIREAILSLWGGTGDWNQGGIDRAAELARLFEANGITDLSQLGLGEVTRPVERNAWEGGDAGSLRTWTEDDTFRKLVYGDKSLGFLGDVNRDNSLAKIGEQDTLQHGGMYGGDLLGWSATGKGNVSYIVDKDKDGNLIVRPQWGSSSDMDDVRTGLMGLAAVAAPYFLGPGAAGGAAVNSAGLTAAEAAALYGGGSAAEIAAMGGGQLLGGAGGAALGGFDPSSGFSLSDVSFNPTFADPAAANFGYDPFASGFGTNAGSFGTGGIGSNTLAGMSGLDPVSFGGLSMGGVGGGGGGFLDSLKTAGSGVVDALGGAKGVMGVAGLLGGIAGAKGGDDVTSSNKRTLDPRLDSAIFGANGQGGLLSRVLEYANQNPTGQNDVMKQASDRQKALLNDPRLWGGLSNLYTQSQGLLNQGVAPNPFKDWRP